MHTDATTTIDVAQLLSLCDGHFPGDPLVPGALQLRLGVELVRESLGVHPTEIRRAAFRAPLRPTGPARVRAIHRPDRKLATVEVLDHAGERCSSFELRFDPIAAPPPSSRPGCEDQALLGPDAIMNSLRHQPPALFIHEQLTQTARGASFSGRARPRWHWGELLDGAAQAAGLSLRRELEVEGQPIYVAAFERVVLPDQHEPRALDPRFVVESVRRVLNLHQFRFAVVDSDDQTIQLSGLVALAKAS